MMGRWLTGRLPLLVFVVVIFILGISFGAFAVRTLDYSNRSYLFNYFNDFMQGLNNLDYQPVNLINDGIRFNLINIVIIWAFGLSILLMPLIAVLIFFKGFVLGFTVGFLISQYGYRGIIVAMAAIFPQNILIIPAYIAAGILGIYLSIRMVRHLRGREKLSFQVLAVYTGRMAVLGMVLLGGSLLESYLVPHLFSTVAGIILG